MNTDATLIAPADINAETKLSHIIETVICGRCGGTGNFGPRSVMAGKCFKCGGSGAVATKRGAAARELYRQLIRTPFEGIRPGDRVLYEGFTAGTMTVPNRWVTVEAVRDNAAAAAEAGSYEAALKACGSCSVLNAEQAEQAAEAGATLYPQTRDGQPAFAAFGGTTLECTTKAGERYSLGSSSRGILAKTDPEVVRAIYRTVAEYQLSLTKAGKPRKGSRWAE